MTTHNLPLERRTIHGHFSRDLPPVLTIDSGDTVIFNTLDGGWFAGDPHELGGVHFHPMREKGKDDGHALCGPVAINGAKAGDTLEIILKKIVPAHWGWSSAGGDGKWNIPLGVDVERKYVRWGLHPADGVGISENGYKLRLKPFMGVMGVAPSEPGMLPTAPPRYCGGNLDCKELVAGTHLFLPIGVAGALFSLGDGHAVQGDGEVSGVAIECPMNHVEVEFQLRTDMHLKLPRAETLAGWITFGFNEDLNEAMVQALHEMLTLMQELHDLDRQTALNLASLVVDLRITQIVNGVCGVHALLPHGVIENVRAG
jgi:acetamidase/formamidase